MSIVYISDLSELDSLVSPHAPICSHHLKVEVGAAFVAIKGAVCNGEEFITIAVQRGANYVISEGYSDFSMIPHIIVPNARIALSYLLRRYYMNLNPKLIDQRIVAITGTNGKTSTAHIYAQLNALLGNTTLYIGTLGIISFLSSNPANPVVLMKDNLTTPDPILLHQVLSENSHCKYVIIEASSHGIEQHRVDFLNIAEAGFTSFSQDHLDDYQTMSKYFQAKLKLFQNVLPQASNATAILNSDIEVMQEIKTTCEENNIKVISYGKTSDDLRILASDRNTLELCVNDTLYNISLPLAGSFQKHNMSCAIGLLLESCYGLKIPDISAVSPLLKNIPGRMERFDLEYQGKKITVYIDYAHTPGAVETVLRELKGESRLWVVIGCGGNRDSDKRSKMGKAAAEFADFVIVTDDNPRCEDPGVIRKEIISGIPPSCRMKEIGLRPEAINYAIQNMADEDVLVIAGKGHEEYQIIGKEKFVYSDRFEILKLF